MTPTPTHPTHSYRVFSSALRRVLGFCAAFAVLLSPSAPVLALDEVCAEMKIGVKSDLQAAILFQREDGSPVGKRSELFGHGEFACLSVPSEVREDERFRVVYQMEPLLHEIPCGANVESPKEAAEDKEYGFLTRSVDLDRIVFTLAKQGCVFVTGK